MSLLHEPPPPISRPTFTPAAERIIEDAPLLDHAPVRAREPLAHHFASPAQQFGAAKLGMWLFLISEILLCSGLFCIYAVLRANKPEIFAWGKPLLDKNLGFINTLILIASSFTMALAVRACQLRRPRAAILLLSLTLVAGVGFLSIKAVEYSDKIHFGLLPGDHFTPNLKYVAVSNGATRKQLHAMINLYGPTPKGLRRGNAETGAGYFSQTCAGCHGADGAGKPNQGANLRASRFIAGKTDEQLLQFVRGGRLPTDPDSVLKLTMPPRGGNPTLDDQKLLDIITYLRTFHQEQNVSNQPAVMPAPDPDSLNMPHSSIALAAIGPAGLATPKAPPRKTLNDFSPPPNAALFFSTYFLLTGLHGLHVLAGMAVITWLLIRTCRGHFDNGHATPMELGGMYWHLVDLIWIVLFPLLYLV
ncbi:MAG: cytochrome c oxidase subunit 3 [Phycisphaerae bacterium]